MNLKRKFAACLTAAAIMLTMLTVALAQDPPGVETDYFKGVVRVVGEGVGKHDYKKNPGKYRLTASKAARMDAQAKLVEYIGVQVETNALMTDYEIDSYRVRSSARGIIRNAVEVEEPKYFEDGTCKVVMEMKLYGGKGSIAEVAFLPFKDEAKVAFPQPVNTAVLNQTTIINNHYTGLIIDCSSVNKELNPVMSPVIKNSNGQPIYGHQNLDYDKIIIEGMASYAATQADCERAGNNPLIVKAVNLTDLDANPVVSVEDADKILAANQYDKFLENCAVVFKK